MRLWWLPGQPEPWGLLWDRSLRSRAAGSSVSEDLEWLELKVLLPLLETLSLLSHADCGLCSCNKLQNFLTAFAV